ncbi:hypothetical protein AGLY_003529 [Aphis glycines]|uniref:Uncharacterized protein n=1 Tax=Aphis glycines TaxID=307491 RepID=A0A6G0U287_APHGL|nr:hypothetical protein AGLY_003529 [Aphis glycines]
MVRGRPARDVGNRPLYGRCVLCYAFRIKSFKIRLTVFIPIPRGTLSFNIIFHKIIYCFFELVLLSVLLIIISTYPLYKNRFSDVLMAFKRKHVGMVIFTKSGGGLPIQHILSCQIHLEFRVRDPHKTACFFANAMNTCSRVVSPTFYHYCKPLSVTIFQILYITNTFHYTIDHYCQTVAKLCLAKGSTPLVGSSKNTTGGSPINAIAVFNFLLLPPLYFPQSRS